MNGLHLALSFYGCRGSTRAMTEAAHLRQYCIDALQAQGLRVMGDFFHQFTGEADADGSGVTGCVVIAESHLAIHTWPELHSVTLDVYVCNYTSNNSDKALAVVAQLERLFAPTQCVRHVVERDRRVLDQTLDAGLALRIESSKLLRNECSAPGQQIEVHDTPAFGRLLRLNGCNRTSERDAFVYHENMVHPAAVAHPAPSRVLVVGGGDGGLAEEALKHPSVERLVLVEFDARVVEVARQTLHEVHRNAFDDARLQLVMDDGAHFVAQATETFDLIFLDLPAPAEPAAPLHEADFLQACHCLLASGGALVLHLGSAWHHTQGLQTIAASLWGVFAKVHPYAVDVPSYGGLRVMAVCSDTLDPTALTPAQVNATIARRSLSDLQYYNGATHQAVFALPNFLQKML